MPGVSAACWALALALAAFFASPARADLKAALAEQNLEKRSDLALKNADEVLKDARKAYDRGDNEALTACVEEIRQSVELSTTSLRKTGKNPRKSPKYFKRAEIAIRDMLRKIDNFQQAMSFADRPTLDALKTQLQQWHDELLIGLMEGTRK